MKGIAEEEGLDNRTIRRKTAKQGKRVLKKDGVSPSWVEEDLGPGFVEPAGPMPVKELKSNVFEMVPPGWKLEESHKEWTPENLKRTIEWKESC